MSRDALVAVAQHSRARGPALLVAFRLADHTNRAGWSWPSIVVLVNETGFSKNTVLRGLAELEEDLAELFVERARNRFGNRYRLRLPGIPGAVLEESPDHLETVPPVNRSEAVDNAANGPKSIAERSQIGAERFTGGTRNLQNPVEPARSRSLGQPACRACAGTGWVETERGVVVECGCATRGRRQR